MDSDRENQTDSDREGQTDSSREDQTDSGREDQTRSDREDQTHSDREEGVLFVSSTISRDDTQSKASKEQGMLAQLNNKFGSGELMLNSSEGVQSAGLGPPNPMSPYPAVPPPFHPHLGRPPQPIYFQDYDSPLAGVPPSAGFPRPFVGTRKPLSKANKNAKWRQKLPERSQASADSAPGDGPNLENRGSSSQSQSVPQVDRVGVGDNISSIQNPEPQSSSRPMADTGKPVSEASQASCNDEEANATNRTEQHRTKHLESIGEGSRVAVPSRITASGTPGEGAESETDKKVTGSETQGPEDTGKAPIPSNLGLAESLSYIAKKHLGINMLNQSAESASFGGYLLDTIEMLENQVSYLRAVDDSSSSSDAEDNEEVQPPRSQVVHRVYCSDQSHDHDNMIYEDEPTIKNSRFMGKNVLSGQVEIPNLTRYLKQRSSICFIILKEHDCALAEKRKRKRQSSQRLERMRIVSSNLQKALEKVAEYPPYSLVRLDGQFKEIDAPYDFLFHHRKQLAALEEKSDTYRAVLVPLREFLDQNYEKEYQSAEALLQRGRVTSLHLGKLFKPNQMVISQHSDSNSLEAYVLTENPERKEEKIVLRGWSWQYNGTKLQRKAWDGDMSPVSDEETVITELSVHPAEFALSKVLEKLDARGEKFWSMKDRQFSTYTGYGWNQDHFYVDARFMVDMSTYQKMHPYATCDVQEPLKFDTWPVTIHRQEILSKQSIMLLPPMTYGFNMHEKRWVSLNVEKIEPTKWDKKAFDRLVLDPKTKELIHALVDVQTSEDKNMGDIIAGKGNGLIILLHGSPGTGKTLTAESVAEIAEKPLYRVTCGDIGNQAREVEKYLESVLYLGKIWGCVLLLDEADVFLEERTMADLQRNSLVSVFLRILEYYEGILILTSNRVGTFDEAFKSRIQVAIHYDNLTKRSRKQIWRNFFDMIENANEGANMHELERRLDELAAEDMNGRQIRNALLTARQLAKHRKERLDWQHLSQVLKTSAAFNNYLKEVRGHTDDQWARNEMIR